MIEAKHLVRTRGGRMVHFETCRYAKTGTRWTWADTVSWAGVRAILAPHSIEECQICHPMPPATTPTPTGEEEKR